MIKKTISNTKIQKRKTRKITPKAKVFQKKKTTNPTAKLLAVSRKRNENGFQARRVVQLLKKVEEKKWNLSKPTIETINNIITKLNTAEKNGKTIQLTQKENEMLHTLL